MAGHLIIIDDQLGKRLKDLLQRPSEKHFSDGLRRNGRLGLIPVRQG
ncbi:hypothetical protein [Neisseria dentiae]|nr:hypothetical protein [Neisseria dentiae]MCQ9327483.1 hypothetical protein [Neisseria dentiae]